MRGKQKNASLHRPFYDKGVSRKGNRAIWPRLSRDRNQNILSVDARIEFSPAALKPPGYAAYGSVALASLYELDRL